MTFNTEANVRNIKFPIGYTDPGEIGLDKNAIVNNTLSNMSLQNSMNMQSNLAAQQQVNMQQPANPNLPVRPVKNTPQQNNNVPFIEERGEPSDFIRKDKVTPAPEYHNVRVDTNGNKTIDNKPFIEDSDAQTFENFQRSQEEGMQPDWKGNEIPEGQEIENKLKKRSGIDVFDKYTDYIEGRSEGDGLLKNFSKKGLRDGLKLPWTTGEQGLMIDIDPKNVFPDDSYTDRHLQGALKYAEEKGISPDKALYEMRSLPQAAQSNGNPDADILYYELTGNSLGLASRAFINKAELLGYKVKTGELTEEQAQQELEDFKKNISKDPQFEQKWFGNDRGSRQVLADLIGQGVGAGLGYAGGKILSSNFGRNLSQRALKAADKAFAKVIEKSPDKVYNALQKSGLIDDMAAVVDSPVKQAAAKRLAENSVKKGYYDDITGVFSDLETKAHSINAVRQLEKEIKAKYPNASDEKIATALYDYAFNKNPKGELAFEIRDAFRGTNLSEDAIDALSRTQKYHIEHPEHTQLAEDIINRYTKEFSNKTPEEVAQILKDKATDGGMAEKYWKVSPEYESWVKSGKNGKRPVQYESFHWDGGPKAGSYFPNKASYDAFQKELEGYYQYIDDLTKYSNLANKEEKEIFNDIGTLNMDSSLPKDADIITKEAIKDPQAVIDNTDDGSLIARFIKRTLKNNLASGENKESKPAEGKEPKPTKGKTDIKSAEGKAGSSVITKAATEGGALLGGALGDHIQANLGNDTGELPDFSAGEEVTVEESPLNPLGKGGDDTNIPYRGPKLEEPLTWEGREKYRDLYDKLGADIKAAESKGTVSPEEAEDLEKRATMYNSFIRSIQNSPLNDIPGLINAVEKAQGKVNDYSTTGMPKTWIGAYMAGEFGDPKSKDAKRTLRYFALNSLGNALMNMSAVIQKRAPTENQWNKAQGLRLEQAYKRYDTAKTKSLEANLDSIAKAMNMTIDQKNKVAELINEGDIKLLYDKLSNTKKLDLLERVARFAPYYSKLSDKQRAMMAAIMMDSGISVRDELGMLKANFSDREIAELIGNMKNAEYLNKMYGAKVTQKQVNALNAQIEQALQSAKLTKAQADLYKIKVYAELASHGVESAIRLLEKLIPGGNK